MYNIFLQFSKKISSILGSPWAFFSALFLMIVWLVYGFLIFPTQSVQLALHTFTGVCTFLLVFLLQNTQNRDTQEIKLKLNELIKTDHNARNKMLDLSKFDVEEIKEIEDFYKKICDKRERK